MKRAPRLAARTWQPVALGCAVLLAWGAIGVAAGWLGSPVDVDGYLSRGAALADGRHVGLTDGFRPPLLPLIFAAITMIFGEGRAFLAAVVTNLVVLAAIPAFWWRLSFESSHRRALRVMALLTAAWPPFFFLAFAPVAESWSFFGVNVALMALLCRRWALAGFACGCLGLLKANLLLVPVAMGVWILSNGIPWRDRLRAAALLASATVAVQVPWMVTMKVHTGRLRPTTSGGYNLLVGTGYHVFGMKRDVTSMPARYLNAQPALTFRPSPHGPSALEPDEIETLVRLLEGVKRQPSLRARLDDVARDTALRIWRRDTTIQVTHGLLKVLHSVGFSRRSLVDYVQLLLLGAMVVSTWMVRRAGAGGIARLHWLLAGTGVVVAFVFLPNLRIKTCHWDISGLLLIAFASEALFGRAQPGADRLTPRLEESCPPPSPQSS